LILNKFTDQQNPGGDTTALPGHHFEVFENSKEIGRVPHVRPGVRGPKMVARSAND
jgi:hypothetical protein